MYRFLMKKTNNFKKNMGLIKNLENGSSIVLLYTNYFAWKDPSKDDVLQNTPETGRVYRALKDGGNNAYYVKLNEAEVSEPTVMGIRISSLKYSNNDFECDMVELNEDNITDFEITPDDYKQINKWTNEEHSDFVQLLENTPFVNVVVSQDDITEEEANRFSEEESAKELSKKIMDAIRHSSIPYKKTAAESIDFINAHDPFLTEVIVDYLVYICRMLQKEDSGATIPFSREISVSDELGKGANVYTAINSIERLSK